MKGHSELYQSERKVKLKEVHEVGCQKLKLPNGIEGQVEIKQVLLECRIDKATQTARKELLMFEKSGQLFLPVVAESHQFEKLCLGTPSEVIGVLLLVVQLFYEVRKGLGHRDDGVRVRKDERYKSFATGTK